METTICIYTYSGCLTGRKYASMRDAVADGGYSVWTDGRVKSTFSFGNGTQRDFDRFCKDNLMKRISVDEFKSIVDSFGEKDRDIHLKFFDDTIKLFNNL